MDYSNDSMYQNQLTSKQLAVHLGIVVVVILAALGIRTAILGTSAVVSLKPAPELAGAISQSLATSGSSAALPIEGVDYKLQGIHYLDDKAWAVATVGSISGNTDRGTVVLERKDNGTYVVALGPGTAFSNDAVEKLPADILQYIKTHGVLIYEPAS